MGTTNLENSVPEVIDHDDEIIAGFYNIKLRKEDVLRRLSMELKHFDTLDFLSDQQQPPTVDMFREKSLEWLVSEANKLKVEITKCTFEGGHFNREYRTLQGHCNKLMQLLDSYDHKDNPGSISQVHCALEIVQDAVNMMKTKVHSSGICCRDCPLYNTKWQ